jgi:hypothetical protein
MVHGDDKGKTYTALEAGLTVPPVLLTAGVPRQREARTGAPPLLRRLRRGRPPTVIAKPATPATGGSLQRMVRQEKVTVRSRRFQGTYLV